MKTSFEMSLNPRSRELGKDGRLRLSRAGPREGCAEQNFPPPAPGAEVLCVSAAPPL